MIIHESMIFCYRSYQGYRREVLELVEIRDRVMVETLLEESTSICHRWSVKRTGRRDIVAPGSGSNTHSVAMNHRRRYESGLSAASLLVPLPLFQSSHPSTPSASAASICSRT